MIQEVLDIYRDHQICNLIQCFQIILHHILELMQTEWIGLRPELLLVVIQNQRVMIEEKPELQFNYRQILFGIRLYPEMKSGRIILQIKLLLKMCWLHHPMITVVLL